MLFPDELFYVDLNIGLKAEQKNTFQISLIFKPYSFIFENQTNFIFKHLRGSQWLLAILWAI